MKRLILIPTILTVLTMLGAFPMAFAVHSTPFRASVSGTFALQSPNLVVAHGTGHATHLGKITMVVSGHPNGPECGSTSTDQVTSTAANGDELFQSFIAVSCPTSTPNVEQFTVTSIVTGGTGRFADASGSGTAQFTIVVTSPTGSGTFSGTETGTISY